LDQDFDQAGDLRRRRPERYDYGRSTAFGDVPFEAGSPASPFTDSLAHNPKVSDRRRRSPEPHDITLIPRCLRVRRHRGIGTRTSGGQIR